METPLYLKVLLWGHEIGRLTWRDKQRDSYFVFNPEYIKDGGRPSDLSYSLKDSSALLPIYSNEDKDRYKYLPAFLSDSLPDNWGSLLFEQWAKDNDLSSSQLTPLLKLSYIGKRGMGALEFIPEMSRGRRLGNIDIASLAELSERIVTSRGNACISADEQPTMAALHRLGSPIGGRMEKIAINIDRGTGAVTSGETGNVDNSDSYILKFGTASFQSAELEQVYYEMAQNAGIQMMECHLMEVEGTNHFLTRRFDRLDGEKIHTQTLAAMAPAVHSYEGLIDLCRELGLAESVCQEVFRRMVFNVLSNNTDDHERNFSFMRRRGGKWELAPAYDLCFIFMRYRNDGYIGNREHCLSIGGKRMGFTRKDIKGFAEAKNIRNADNIIKKISMSLETFRSKAASYNIDPFWVGRIDDTLRFNMAEMEELEIKESFSFTSKSGKVISDLRIEPKSNGAYQITALVDGDSYKCHLHVKSEENQRLSSIGITRVNPDEIWQIVFEQSESNKKVLPSHPLLQQYLDIKKTMPNLVPLFHVSGGYETYQADAELVAKVLKIPVLESATHIGPDGKAARYVAISEHDLEGCRKILLDNKVGMALLEDCNLEKDDVKDDSLRSPEPLSHERNESLDLGKDGSHGRHR